MQELWTPVGMRSLAPTDPRYAPRYSGTPRERDAVYHQGTVWSWLLGPFAIAHYRVYDDTAAALALLDGIAAHLRDGCIGQVSEIFDARGALRAARLLRAGLGCGGNIASVERDQ